MEEFETTLSFLLFEEQKPVPCSYMAKETSLPMSNIQQKMREFYANNLDKIKAIFSLTYIKDQFTLKNVLVSEEELTDFLNDSEKKESIVDFYVYALSPPKYSSEEIHDLIFGIPETGEIYNIKKLDIAVRDLSINVHNKATLGEDVQDNLAQPVLKKPKLEAKPTTTNNSSSQKKPTNVNNVVTQKTEKPSTPNIFAKNPQTKPPAKKEEKKVSADIKKPNPIKKQEKNVVEPQKIVTEDCDDEECYYGTPVEEKNQPEKEKIEENILEKDSQSMKIEVPQEKTKQSQSNDASKLKLEVPKEKIETKVQSEAPLDENHQNNVENIAPEGEKFEIVKKKRRVKKTIEEMNAKGQLVSRDVWEDEEYEEKKEIKPKPQIQKQNANPPPATNFGKKGKTEKDVNQPSLMSFFKKK